MKSKLIKISLLLLIIFGVYYGAYAKDVLDAKKPKTQSLFKVSQTESILLKSRRFTPTKGISSVLANKIKARAPKKTHVLLQFETLPTAEQKKQLLKNGVKLLAYIPNKAWLASITSAKPEEIAKLFNVRAITEILSKDKISLAVKNKNYLKNEKGAVNLLIMFFNDVDLEKASLMLKKYGQVVDKSYSINAVKLITEEKFIAKLANQETVQWIDVIDKILYTHNDGNRENIGVNILQASPYNLSGAGIVTAEWDGGWVDASHNDLQGRVIIGDTGSSVGNHATHVAGTMLGNGALSQTQGGTALAWRGMAPQATVISYEWWNSSTELNNEYNTAINTYNASLSQNSWGYTYPGCGNNCSGGYDIPASELDGIVRGSKGKKINIIWSAGNARPSGCDSGEYDCIGLPGTAKNIITIGATNSDDDSMTYFSSWGPTNDGRLKPEVTAPGCEGDRNDGTITGSVWSTVPTDTYSGMCGTSMAAPTASGVIALMLEEFATEAIYPLPSTIKALLTHTANDLGNTGPDYSFGYGRINALSAIDKIKAGSYIEGSIGHGGTDIYSLNVPAGTTEIKITLVWDDEPATANANPSLVNDLDLIVKDPSNIQYYPWTLNPASPSSPAIQTQADHTNNIEQVLIDTSITSGSWIIEVFGYNAPSAPQTYSLIFTPNYGDSIIGKLYKDSGYTNEKQFFDKTEPVYIEAYIISAGSPLTGAVVTADLILVSSSSTIAAITLQDVGGGYYRELWDSTSQPAGVYSVNINVASPALNAQKYFHLYPQTGVSSYNFDYNNDGNNDYVLENKHLIAIFDGKTNTDKSLLYLYQKDTDTAYNFAGISDTNTIGRGEITTTNLKGIKFYSFSFSQAGEELATATLNMTTEVSDPTEELITYYDSSNGDGNYFIDDDQWIGERFNPADLDTDYTLTKVSVYVGKGSRASNPLTVEIRTDSSGSPSNTILTSESIPASSVPSSSAWLDVTFSSQITLEQGGLYWLVLRNTNTRQGNPDNPNYAYTWTGDGTSPTYPGRMAFSQNQGTSWTDASASYDMIFRAYGEPAAITTTFDLSVQMKTEDVDYLVYKLSNFDEYIDDISDIFSPISGALGSSAADDRYHFGDGTDGLISSLTASAWTNFTTSSNQQRYVAIYDNSTSSDSTANNVISWVYFPNTTSTAFQDVGAWYETGKGGLRLRYDTTSATATNEAEYILAFTKGNYTNIDYWMPTIASGQFPNPNFMSGELTLTRPDFPANAWQMISVPLEPTTSTPEAIIGDDVGNIFYDWMLAYWQPAEEKFKYHQATCCPWAQSATSTLSIAPGLSYWLVTRLGPYDIDATGSLVPDSDYYISILPGWNQIGVPFNYSVAWASSTIKVKNTATNETVDIDIAQQNGWMENKIWWWDGAEYEFAVSSEGQLDPWEGYWVYSTTSVELIISPTPRETTATVSSMNLSKQSSKPKWKDAESEWKLRLMITANNKRDTYNFAGMSSAAEDGYDALDVAEPPAISSSIALYFPHPDWPFAGGNYAQDMKKLDSKIKKWYFEVKNEVQQMPITLKWLNLEQAVYHSLSLIDLDTNQNIDLYNTAEYIFDLEKGGIRHFELTARKARGQGQIFNKKK